MLVTRSGCITFLEWQTSAACTHKSLPQEVPCIAYTADGKLINLNPLIKLRGAYRVQDGFYINVCREITTGE